MSLVGDDSSHLVIQWSKPKLYHLLHIITYDREECAVCAQVLQVYYSLF